MNTILSLDAALFRWVNQGLAHPWLDAVMPLFWHARAGLLLLAVVLLYLGVTLKRRVWPALLLVIGSVGVTDLLIARVIKPSVGRIRPCFALEDVRLPYGKPGGQLSFPSAHAGNTAAAAAAVLYFSVPAGGALWAISGFTSFSRMYVGVHYPLDVGMGTLLGWGVAALLRALQKRWAASRPTTVPA